MSSLLSSIDTVEQSQLRQKALAKPDHQKPAALTKASSRVEQLEAELQKAQLEEQAAIGISVQWDRLIVAREQAADQMQQGMFQIDALIVTDEQAAEAIASRVGLKHDREDVCGILCDEFARSQAVRHLRPLVLKKFQTRLAEAEKALADFARANKLEHLLK